MTGIERIHRESESACAGVHATDPLILKPFSSWALRRTDSRRVGKITMHSSGCAIWKKSNISSSRKASSAIHKFESESAETNNSRAAELDIKGRPLDPDIRSPVGCARGCIH